MKVSFPTAALVAICFLVCSVASFEHLLKSGGGKIEERDVMLRGAGAAALSRSLLKSKDAEPMTGNFAASVAGSLASPDVLSPRTTNLRNFRFHRSRLSGDSSLSILLREGQGQP
jgi:hypothetical protein